MKKVQLLPLKNQKSFDLISKKAVKYSSRFFVLLASNIENFSAKLTNKDINSSCMNIYTGFKISRKFGKAHERNLLRRRLKEIFKIYIQKRYNPIGIIFIPRTASKDLEYSSLKEEMFKAINWCIKKLEL